MGYIRRSKDKQALSPEGQRANIEAYCAARGVRLVAVFIDSLTGDTPLAQRPGFTSAVAALREHGAGLLIVSDRTRIARDAVISALAERAAVAGGASMVSADGAANGTSPADAFMRGVLAAASEYERAMIRKRTCDALAAKRAKGEKTGGEAPYGYRAELDARGVALLVADPGEQAVVARVRALRADDVSYARIARQLAAEGVKPRSGSAWHETQVRRILVRTQPAL